MLKGAGAGDRELASEQAGGGRIWQFWRGLREEGLGWSAERRTEENGQKCAGVLWMELLSMVVDYFR